MARKFDELTQSEQAHFQGLVSLLQQGQGARADVMLNIINRFDLDLADPVVTDFLIGVQNPVMNTTPLNPIKVVEPELPEPLPTAPTLNPPIQPQGNDELSKQGEQADNTTKSLVHGSKKAPRVMTYAHSEDLIIIQNRLLHAISHLTLNERRLILFLSPIVRKQIEQMPDNRTFYVHAQDFAKEYQLKGKFVYSELEKTADSIVEKAFFFWYKTKNGKAKKGVSWVSECDYIEKEGRVKIKLDDTVIEMLTVFDESTGNLWSKYQKEWITHLGVYGIIMLELALSLWDNSFDKKEKGVYTVEHLREKFDCVDRYPIFADFKRYVIDKAIKEIHQYTPIRIDYTVDKVGKTTKSVHFSYVDTSIKEKEVGKNNDSRKNINLKDVFKNFKMTENQLLFFAPKVAKVVEKDVQEVIDELCNVHLQSQYVTILKALEFVPSDYYTEDEIKTHLTQEQVDKLRQNAQKEQEQQAKLEQIQLQQDFKKLLHFAEEFVLANQKMVSSGIGKTYLKEKNYQQIVMLWEMRLLDKESRADFKMVDELLARDVP